MINTFHKEAAEALVDIGLIDKLIAKIEDLESKVKGNVNPHEEILRLWSMINEQRKTRYSSFYLTCPLPGRPILLATSEEGIIKYRQEWTIPSLCRRMQSLLECYGAPDGYAYKIRRPMKTLYLFPAIFGEVACVERTCQHYTPSECTIHTEFWASSNSETPAKKCKWHPNICRVCCETNYNCSWIWAEQHARNSDWLEREGEYYYN